MSTQDTMARLPGLFQRGDAWQVRVMIPKDLQTVYSGRSKLVEALGTTDRSTAKVLGTARRAILLAEFDQKRRHLNPQKVESVSPELGKVLAQRVASRILGTDQRLREDPEAARLLLDTLRPMLGEKLRIGSAAPTPAPTSSRELQDPLHGLDTDLAAELADLNSAVDTHAALQMAMQRVSAVLPLVKAEALALGLEFDEKAPGALPKGVTKLN